VNPFRQLMMSAGHQTPMGTWILSASPLVAEAVGHAGFDWGVVDMEHSPLDLREATQMLQALGNTKMVPVLRVPWNDAVTVKRVLDAGATTVMFPFVQNADEARRAVAATRYPPQGVRGMVGMSRATHFGTLADYAASANQTIGVIVQLESAAALDALDAIAEVPGVDALFIGPADLSADMGFGGHSLHPTVVDAMSRAARRAAAHGKPIGTLGLTPQQAAQYRAMGFNFVGLGSDLGLLMGGAKAALQSLQNQAGGAAEVHTLAEGTQTA
jgi:2-keto-3-deoxy-L-rhamnonate aldolase RhmA